MKGYKPETIIIEPTDPPVSVEIIGIHKQSGLQELKITGMQPLINRRTGSIVNFYQNQSRNNHRYTLEWLVRCIYLQGLQDGAEVERRQHE